jgi:hypothetical protein
MSRERFHIIAPWIAVIDDAINSKIEGGAVNREGKLASSGGLVRKKRVRFKCGDPGRLD